MSDEQKRIQAILYLYIGLPKTGTSFWYHKVVARLEDVLLVQAAYESPLDFPVIKRFRNALKSHSALSPVAVQQMAGYVRDLAALHSGDIVVANENITIQPAGFWNDVGSAPRNLAEHIRALQAALPEMGIRVIFGIRRQDYWLASRYVQSARSIPNVGQEDFDRRVEEICARAALEGPMEWLLYQSATNTLAEAVGAENLLVQDLADLETDPRAAILELGRFIGNRDCLSLVDEMEQRGELTTKVNRRRQVEEKRWQIPKRQQFITLSERQSGMILDRFRETPHLQTSAA